LRSIAFQTWNPVNLEATGPEEGRASYAIDLHDTPILDN
jgi:hypothetical protein